MNNYTEEYIQNEVIQWTTKYLKDFQFRQYQLEYIVKTLSAILNDKLPLNIIEAPTGSGKSIMVLVMAGVLDKSFDKKSYILCSDLYLWEQYAKAITDYDLYFGKIKGTLHNYICMETGDDFTMAPCRMAGIPYSKMFSSDWCYNNDWRCACTCSYIRERYKALHSNVTLMTYQLYFPYMCDVDIAGNDEYSTFMPRDVVFCDECHNVPDLCQQYCAITLDLHYDCDRFRTFLQFCKTEQYILEDGSEMRLFNIDQYISEMYELYGKLQNTPYNYQKDLYDLLQHLMYKMNIMVQCQSVIEREYKLKQTKKKKRKRLTRREYIALDAGKWISKLANAIKIYCTFSELFINYIVKTDNMINDPTGSGRKIWPSKPVVSFKFAKEDVLVYRCILSNQPHTVMLSATVGDQQSFDDNIGTKLLNIDKSNMMMIPSTFDFSKSPIFFIPGNKMSQDYIYTSIRNNAAIISRILQSQKHIAEKGIIHTGSYKNAYDLYRLLDPAVQSRIYIYGTSQEKKETLERYKHSTNGILIGPTLTEGIDLPNDGCRFIVILKIPYPYLGDNLVKAKKALFPRWYDAQTINTVIQGIGRGNRTPDDWSTTYILDDCFSSLYQDNMNQFSESLKNRMYVINS